VCTLLRDHRKYLNSRARWRDGDLLPKVEAIVADLFHARCTGKDAIGVHCSPASAWMRKPYRHDEVQTSRLSPLLNEMEDARIIRIKRGSQFAGMVSRVSFGPWLAKQFSARLWSLADIGCAGRGPQSIVLKEGKDANGNGVTIAYRDTPAIRALRQDLLALNEWIAGFDISIRLEGSDRSIRELDSRDRTLHRVFNNASFQSHGRLYGGFWINMHRDERWRIRLDGEPLAYVDFKSLNVQLCYARTQKPLPEGDLYEWAETRNNNLKRNTVKAVLNARLNGYRGGSKYPALKNGDPADLYPTPKSYRPNTMLEEIARHHRPIAGLLGQRVQFKTHNHYPVSAAIGHALTHTESEILLDALRRCRAEAIPALPVHDALLVPVSRCKRATEILAEAFRAITHATSAARIDVEMLTAMSPPPLAFKAHYDGKWHDTAAEGVFDPTRLVKLEGEPLFVAKRVFKHYASIEYGLLAAQTELGTELPLPACSSPLITHIFFSAVNYARWIALCGVHRIHPRKYEKRNSRRSTYEQGRREARHAIYCLVKYLSERGQLEDLNRELEAVELRQRKSVALGLCVAAAQSLGLEIAFKVEGAGHDTDKAESISLSGGRQLQLTYRG